MGVAAPRCPPLNETYNIILHPNRTIDLMMNYSDTIQVMAGQALPPLSTKAIPQTTRLLPIRLSSNIKF